MLARDWFDEIMLNSRDFLYVQEKDEGRWTCRAENAAGTDEVVHQIILNRPPSVVPLFLGYVSSTSVQIHWEPPHKPEPPVTGELRRSLLEVMRQAFLCRKW